MSRSGRFCEDGEKLKTRIILGVIAGFLTWWVTFLAIAGLFVLLIPGYLEAGRLAQDQNDWSQFSNSMLLFMTAMYVVINPITGWVTVFITRNRNCVWATMAPLILYAAHAHLYRLWNILPDWYNLAVVFLIPPLVYLGGRIVKLEPAQP